MLDRKRTLITQVVNKSKGRGLQCLLHLAPSSQGNQDRFKYLVLAPILSGESRCTGVTGYGGKARDVKYLNTVCSQHQKEDRGGWRRKHNGGREVTERGKDDRNKETDK